MKTLLSLLLLCSFAAADDWVITDTAPEPPAAAAPDVDVTQFVFSARVRGNGVVASGSAVSIGDGVLQTVAHLWHDIPGPLTTEVQLEGEWVPATYRIVSPANQKDVALLRVRRTDLPKPVRREAKYRESVYVYGMKTRCLQSGFVTSSTHVSLDENETGTEQGDSGGGVFSVDGAFLGTVGARLNEEHRVAIFAPNDFEVRVNPVAVSKPAIAAPSVAAPQNCPSGNCPIQSPAMQSGHYERGFFGRMRWVPN